MTFTELFLLAVGLAMDAFAVSVCKGLAAGKTGIKQMVTAGAWFGAFQAIMPAAGFALSSRFGRFMEPADHWIAFVLLAGTGANMVRSALKKDGGEESGSMEAAVMAALAVATSIDAFAAGISLGMLHAPILTAAAVTGAVSFVLSAAGIWMGGRFARINRSAAELAGGGALIALGARILLRHFGA